MKSIAFTEAFRAYKAKLTNHMWAFSAIASDGALVLSCWAHKLKLRDGVLRYNDRLSRWEPSSLGRKLLAEHLALAKESKLPVRLVIATTDQPDVVDRGEEAQSIRKTFHIKPEVTGRVVFFDGDSFELEFRRNDGA